MSIKVFLYTLGKYNKKDYIDTLVPYEIDSQKLFFGPCKKGLRQKIKELYLKDKDYVNLKKRNYEIYIVGLGPNKIKNEISNFIFTGKIEKLFTFQKAWHYYHKRMENHPGVKEMILGHKDPKDGKIKSPLHLKPVPPQENADLIGYKHYLHEHDYDWICDLLSTKELKKYMRKFKLELKKKEDFISYIKKNEIEIAEIFKEEDITFQRDCCFSLKNIFISRKHHINPLPMDDFFIEKIKKSLKPNRLKYKKKPDKYSPLGYCKDETKYGGRGQFFVINGKDAEEFIEHLNDRLNNKNYNNIC